MSRRVVAYFAALFAVLFPLCATAELECVQLAFVRPHPPQVVPSDARTLLGDVNAARAQRGLAPLVADESLARFALSIAHQMAVRHYFGHTDPNGVTFLDRLRAAGLGQRYAAENMAFDQDEEHAHAAFIHSPDHYRNIIDSHLRKIGVAVVAAGDGEVFFVEEFAD
jgi:uncharacterized protein YkwD